MSSKNQNDYLVHFGVLGMKWGVRKSKSSESSGSSSSKVRKGSFSKKIKKQVKKASSKSPKNMSDEDLKKAISRLELERRYRTLNRESVSSGKKFVRDVLKDSAKNIASQLITTGAKAIIKDKTGFDMFNPGQKKKD